MIETLCIPPAFLVWRMMSSDMQASMASDSGALHSLPAYSYLAKPFQPPGGQDPRREKPSLRPCASADAAPKGGAGPQTPSEAALAASAGLAMCTSAHHTAGVPRRQTFPTCPKRSHNLAHPFQEILQSPTLTAGLSVYTTRVQHKIHGACLLSEGCHLTAITGHTVSSMRLCAGWAL